MTWNSMIDGLRRYVLEYGAQQTCDVIAVILDEQSDRNRGQPAGTIADINAAVIRHAMTKMVR